MLGLHRFELSRAILGSSIVLPAEETAGIDLGRYATALHQLRSETAEENDVEDTLPCVDIANHVVSMGKLTLNRDGYLAYSDTLDPRNAESTALWLLSDNAATGENPRFLALIEGLAIIVSLRVRPEDAVALAMRKGIRISSEMLMEEIKKRRLGLLLMDRMACQAAYQFVTGETGLPEWINQARETMRTAVHIGGDPLRLKPRRRTIELI